MAATILSLFNNRHDAEEAINELETADIRSADISVIMLDKQEAAEVAETTGSKVVKGTAAGATTGGMIGGLTGLLVGIGAIAIPGLGAVLIGGPIAAALGLTGAAATTVSAAATGALAGGVVGALQNLGVPEEHAKHYEDRLREGAVLLAVPAKAGHASRIETILRDHGASDIQTIELA